MKSQEEIIFDIISLRHHSGWWRECGYKSFGSIKHWIYVYASLNLSEQIIIHSDKITLGSETIAIFTFDDELQMPVFEFNQEYDWTQKQQDIYLKNLRLKKKNVTL